MDLSSLWPWSGRGLAQTCGARLVHDGLRLGTAEVSVLLVPGWGSVFFPMSQGRRPKHRFLQVSLQGKEDGAWMIYSCELESARLLEEGSGSPRKHLSRNVSLL